MTATALLAADVLSLMIALALVLTVRRMIFGPVTPPHFTVWCSITVWFGVRWINSLYCPFGLYPPEKLKRSFVSSAAALIVHLSLLAGLTQFEPWRVFNIALWPLVLPFTYGLRGLARAHLVSSGEYGTPVVIIGSGPPARRAIREMLSHSDLGYVPVGVFSSQYLDASDRHFFGGVPVIGRAEDAIDYEFPYPVRTAMIVVGETWQDEQNQRFAERLAGRYPVLQIFSSFNAHGHWLSQARPLGPYLIIETSHHRFSMRQRVLKRMLDIAIGLPVFILALPFVAIAGLAIYLADPGPILFSQIREGRDGKPIRIYKLRSMVVGAEAKLAAFLAADPGARFEYERTMKLRNDPRIIPRVGKFIRKSSLDEIPQLWSIVIGTMSLVGPRVMPSREVDLYSEAGRELRREVSPGLTGFWQVEHRSDSDFKIREIADSFYVSNWSVWLDLWIILRTVRVVLTGSGAF
ncbi:MAG: exopolysaccharide biosynthesis polyprenyl glycosylphosphotransferase [Sphingomicrobium sp.]